MATYKQYMGISLKEKKTEKMKKTIRNQKKTYTWVGFPELD